VTTAGRGNSAKTRSPTLPAADRHIGGAIFTGSRWTKWGAISARRLLISQSVNLRTPVRIWVVL